MALNNHHCTTEEYFNTVLEIVKAAGKVLTEGYHTPKNIETKLTSWDLVTEYDKRIEKILIESISAAFPSHKFIGEETSNEHSTLTDEPTWLIDPIDGTTNFVHSNPHCCISVALAIKKEIVIGIVFNPILDQLFTAKKGQGAFLNDKPICTSKTKDVDSSLLGFESSLARTPRLREKFLKRLHSFIFHSHGVRTMGSCALALCYVAMGAWDAYQVDDLFCWDYSAGVLIVKEAGGTVISTDGSQFEIMKQRVLAAGTVTLAAHLVDLIRKADES